MTTYRAGVIGLGRMGWLYDASLPYPPSVREEDGTLNELPPLRDHSDIPPTEHPGKEGLPTSYAAALQLHPRTELVAGCDPSEERLAAFGKHHGVKALYTDYRELLTKERLDLVAIAAHAALRPDATALAVECGAKAVLTEKPMTLTLAEADRMVEVCEQAGVPLACGAISVNHPGFVQAKKLLTDGTLGAILSMETSRAMAQHNAWIYLVDSPGEWVIGVSDDEASVRRNGEFEGTGIIQFANGVPGFLRPGAPQVRITGEHGELIFDWKSFRLWLDVDGPGGTTRAEMAFPEPQVLGQWSILYGVEDVIRCHEQGGEPRVSGRRVRDAMEIEIGLRESHRAGNTRVALPLADRSLGMVYDWFR